MTKNIIDNQVLTRFPGKITLTEHAQRTAAEYMGVEYRAAYAEVCALVRGSVLLSENVVDQSGNKRRMFANRGYVFILSQDTDCVVTLYPQNNAIPDVAAPVNALLAEMKERFESECASRIAAANERRDAEVLEAQRELTTRMKSIGSYVK